MIIYIKTNFMLCTIRTFLKATNLFLIVCDDNLFVTSCDIIDHKTQKNSTEQDNCDKL